MLEGRIREDFQNFRDTFFLWVLISAGAVAIGCILEGPEIAHELFPRITRSFTWQSDQKLHRFERRIKKVAALGWLLICAGVLGEGVFELLQNRAEGQLQTFNDTLLADAKRQVLAAQLQAEDAAASADRSDSDAKDAQAKAKLLARDEKAVEDEARDTKYLISMAAWNLNPRTVSDPDSLRNSFSTYSGMPVTFRSFANDGEPYFLCLQLAAIAGSAHMAVTEECGTRKPVGDPIKGFSVSSPTQDLSEKVRGFFTSRTGALGPGPYAIDPPTPTLQIFVGTRYGFPTKAPPPPTDRKMTPAEIKKFRQMHPSK